MKRYALTAIGRDRPGIVTAVTRALYENDCNIEDSSMTILEDEFAIILIMTMPDEAKERALKAAMKAVEKDFGLAISVREIAKKAAGKPPQSNYIITLHGADKAGIVYKTSDILSRAGVNITDLETTAVTAGDKKLYIMVLEVFLPPLADVKEIEQKLKALGKELGVSIKIKPVEAYEPL